jgi:hypothetical protein
MHNTYQSFKLLLPVFKVTMLAGHALAVDTRRSLPLGQYQFFLQGLQMPPGPANIPAGHCKQEMGGH